MSKRPASARRAAKTAKAEAKRKEREEKKAIKESTEKLARTLVAQFRTISDEAQASALSSCRKLAEIAFRLQEECGFTQLRIALATDCQQPWISKLLSWRERDYEGTPSIHVPVAQKLFPGNNPAAPDPTVGMPKGPNLTLVLLPDNSVVEKLATPVPAGNDTDASAAQAENAKHQGVTSPASKSTPVDVNAMRDDKDARSKAALKNLNAAIDECLPEMNTTEKQSAFDYFKLHPKMVGVKRKAA